MGARAREENAAYQAKLEQAEKDASDKDARIAALEAEVAFLRKLNAEGNALRKELEEKIRVLQNLLDMNDASLRSGQGAGADGAGAGGAGADGADGANGAGGEGADGSDRSLGDGSATGRGGDD